MDAQCLFFPSLHGLAIAPGMKCNHELFNIICDFHAPNTYVCDAISIIFHFIIVIDDSKVTRIGLPEKSSVSGRIYTHSHTTHIRMYICVYVHTHAYIFFIWQNSTLYESITETHCFLSNKYLMEKVLSRRHLIFFFSSLSEI